MNTIPPRRHGASAAAIDTGLTAFKEDSQQRLLVLLPDGEDNDSEAAGTRRAKRPKPA